MVRRVAGRAACALTVSVVAAFVFAVPAVASDTSGLVSVGSPQAPFSQNKQNEPAIAVNQSRTNVLAQGANDNIDMEACNAGTDTTCPFTPGVGVSGLAFSLNSGSSWMQPTYSGYSARNCLGVVGPDPGCTPQTPAQGGQIGTLPWYYENGAVSDGDPALAFGPKRANGSFSWANGSRLYYANLTANFASKRSDFAIKGVEGVGVSRTDHVTAAANGHKRAWKPPVLIPSSSGAAFADKEQIWADNASSSPHFGNAYVCFANYRGGPSVGSGAHDLLVATSRNGGASWSKVQVASVPGSASGTKFAVLSGASGCTIRTASDGTVYVFWLGWNQKLKQNGIYMAKSADGGKTFSAPRRLFQVVHTGVFDPVQGRFEMDGITGARDDLSDAPSVDIANAAPTGGGATNRIVMTWVDGGAGLNHEQVMFTTSTDGGRHWTPPRAVESSGDRGYYSAAAISPNGQDVYLVYNAFTAPYQTDTSDPRPLVGVVEHADVTGGSVGQFSEINRGASGDARASSANALTDEFLGDYVYAVATNHYGAAVWNDVRRAADCPAVDAWRMSLEGGPSAPQPAPEQDCPAHFGNTDIFGGAWADPTP
jgi:hypothetical protein